jgi:hypothetical protein
MGQSAVGVVGALVVTLAAGACASPSPSPTASASPGATASLTDGPAVAVAERDGIRLELTLERQHVRLGEVVHARVILSNNGPLVVQRETNTCGSGPAPIVVEAGSGLGVGRQWDGLAGEWKRLLLANAGLADGGRTVVGGFTQVIANQPPGVEVGCDAWSSVQPFGNGDGEEMLLAWRAAAGDGMVLAPGPATVRATFRSAGEFALPPEPVFELSVEAPIELVGDEPAAQLTLADYADVALGVPQFADWLTLAPRDSWTDPHFITWPAEGGGYPAFPPYDRLNGRPVVEIGLFREVDGFYGAVIIDRATGEVLGTRFE